MGKSKYKRKTERFLQIYHSEISSEAWRSLGHPAVRVLVHLRSKFNGYNAKDISLTYKEMDPFMNRRTLKNAFDQLEQAGFIKKKKQGGLLRNSNIFELSNDWHKYRSEKTKIKDK